MDPISAKMREIYDRSAPHYARTTGQLDMFPGLEAELAHFADQVPTPGPILDLGCGVGRDAHWLDARGYLVVAADLSLPMVQVAAGRVPNAECVQLEMTTLPFGEDVFAGAWVCASLVHVPAALLPAAIAELHRTLRPGGVVAISMKEGTGAGWVTGSRVADDRWFTYVTGEGFAELLRASGFVDVFTRPSDRGTWFVAEGIKPDRRPTRPDRSPERSA